MLELDDREVRVVARAAAIEAVVTAEGARFPIRDRAVFERMLSELEDGFVTVCREVFDVKGSGS